MVPQFKGRSWKVFKSRVLSRIFGSDRQDIRAGWRILHNEELCACNLGVSRNVINYSDQMKGDEMGMVCGKHGRDEKCRQNFKLEI